MSGIVRFCGICFIKEEAGEPYALLLPPYGKRTQYKIPGGMQEPTDSSPFAAACRESKEELGILPTEPETTPVASLEDPNNPLSLRDFWASASWAGEIRTEPKADNGEIIPPPVWTKIDHSLLTRDMVVYTHRKALHKVIVWGVNKYVSFYYLAKNEGLV